MTKTSETNTEKLLLEESILSPEKGKSKVYQHGTTGKGSEFFLFITAVLVNLNFFTVGCSMVWTSPVFSRLKSDNATVNPLGYPITPVEESMIAGIFALGMMSGPLLTSKTADILGRKKLILTVGSLQLVCYVVLSVSKHIYLLYLTRFLLGTCTGIAAPILVMYLSEITEKHNRGRYSSMLGLFAPIGNLYGYVLGPLFSVPMFTFLCAIPSFLYVPLILFVVPESPVHLMSKGDVDGAVRNLRKLRNRPHVVEDVEEIKSIIETQHESEKFNWKGFTQNTALKRSFLIAIGLNVLQAFSGILIIMSFLGPIFDNAEIELSGNSVAILVGLTKVVTFMFTSAIVEKSGRRPLLLVSTIFTSLSHFILGLFFYLKLVNFTYLQQISWLPVVCILVFISSYSLGIGGVIWIYLGEVFPNNIKSFAVPMSILTFMIVSTVLNFSFPILVQYFGIPLCFWIFSCCCAIGVVFVYLVIPETKGKTLLEIQEMLRYGKR